MNHGHGTARRARVVIVGLAVAVACEPPPSPPGLVAPVNACPAHPCSAYAHGPAATCSAEGLCVQPGISTAGIELVVSLPADSSFAPPAQYAQYAQYVMPYDRLAECPTGQTCACAWPTCAYLPPLFEDYGGYQMSPCVQSPPAQQCAGALGFFLGNLDPNANTPTPVDTWLPVHATFRLLKDAWNNDITSLGLPIQPVEAAQVSFDRSSRLGPFGSVGIGFRKKLPPGTYERTIAPDPDYNVVFGPQVIPVTFPNKVPFDTVYVGPNSHYDFTREIPYAGTTLPTFDIARAEGLGGWKAFLRDTSTKRALSNVRPLSGTKTPGVQLVTNHGTKDALDNAELVLVPPAGVPVPTGVFAPLGGVLPGAITYPPLPSPVLVTGDVTGSAGEPVAADLVFEALAITDATGSDNPINFEFVGRVSARPGPGGASSYAIELPPGPYRVDVRPLGGSGAVTVALRVVDARHAHQQQDFPLAPPRSVTGAAIVADGRPLAGATVDAVPEACDVPAALARAESAPQTLKALDQLEPGFCLPRFRQAVTDSSGEFTLALDPGRYRVRVKPADGTGLPWASASVLVGPAAPSPLNLVVPAPFHARFKLLGAGSGPNAVPVVRAVVQAFAGPVQIGETLTGSDGTCDLYMALPQ